VIPLWVYSVHEDAYSSDMGVRKTVEWQLQLSPEPAQQRFAEALRSLDMEVEEDERRLVGKAARALRKNRWAAEIVIAFRPEEAGTTTAVATVDMAGTGHGAILKEIAGAAGIEAKTLSDQRREDRASALEQRREDRASALEQRRQRLNDKIEALTQTLRLGGIQVIDGRVETPSGGGPLAGAQATVDSAGDIDRRITATRLILTGPFAFGLRKKKDSRELYLLIEGDGFAHVEEVNPKKRKETLVFVAEFNKRARASTSATQESEQPVDAARAAVADPPEGSGVEPAVDPTEQLQRLAGLRDSGVISDDEFIEAKRRILGSL
jgi:Short C-terminal domain